MKAKKTKSAKSNLAASASIKGVSARNVSVWGISVRGVWGFFARDITAIDIFDWDTCADIELYSINYWTSKT